MLKNMAAFFIIKKLKNGLTKIQEKYIKYL